MYRGGKIVEDMDSYIDKGGISALFGKAMESKLDLSGIFGPKIGSNSPQKK
jgi:hypothetical protein